MSTSIGMPGRTVLVTGGAGGLGSAIASTLLEVGATVALSDVSDEALEATRVQLGGERVRTFRADMSDAESAAALPTRVWDECGRLDGVVYAAGIIRTTQLGHVPAEQWDTVLRVNLTGAFHVVQSAGVLMSQQDAGGSMVILSSVAARRGRARSAHYAASKAGLISLAQSAALAFGPKVRVNSVLPGVFLTPMWDDIDRQNEEEFGPDAARRHHEGTVAQIPLARTGDPSELAAVVAFLLSDASSYVTGQSLNVDGGLERD